VRSLSTLYYSYNAVLVQLGAFSSEAPACPPADTVRARTVCGAGDHSTEKE
jgi:hypothetical protein